MLPDRIKQLREQAALSARKCLVLDGYTAQEIELLYQLTAYFDAQR